MLLLTSFQVCFWQAISHMVDAFVGFRCACFSYKCTNCSKQEPPYMQTNHFWHVRRLPKRLPFLRTSQTRTAVRIQVAGFVARAHFSIKQVLFQIGSIEQFRKTSSRKMDNVNVKSTLPVIWHALGHGLANLVVVGRMLDGSRTDPWPAFFPGRIICG